MTRHPGVDEGWERRKCCNYRIRKMIEDKLWKGRRDNMSSLYIHRWIQYKLLQSRLGCAYKSAKV